MDKSRCSIWRYLTVAMLLLQGLWLTAHSVAEARTISESENDLDVMVVKTSDGCPPEWDSFANSCYRIFGSDPSERKVWEDAFSSCANRGSLLVTIHNKDEQDYLASYLFDMRSDIWIGMHLAPDTGIFKWTDASKADFNNFDENEPSFGTGQEECVEMRYNATEVGKWGDDNCANVLPYICVIDKDTLPPSIQAKRIRRGRRDDVLARARALYHSYTGRHMAIASANSNGGHASATATVHGVGGITVARAFSLSCDDNGFSYSTASASSSGGSALAHAQSGHFGWKKRNAAALQ